MRAGLGLSIAATIAALTAVGASAQTATPPTQPPQTPPNQPVVVGPRELRDFSLGGTPARPADTTPPAQPPATSAQPGATPPPTSDADAPSPRRVQRDLPASTTRAPALTPQAAPPEPSFQAPIQQPQASAPVDMEPQFAPAPISPSAAMPVEQERMPWWPWWLAAAVLAVGAVLLFRQRSRRALESVAAPGSVAFRPDPAPEPAAPQPRSALSEPAGYAKIGVSAGGGIVSTRLRPWIELEFVPSRCILDEEKAKIEFVIRITNSGNAAAREMLVETMVFNAGPEQDADIGEFFRRPPQTAERLAALPPLKSVEIAGSVAIPVDRLRILEAAGRQFFVPLVGFNALYGWGGGEGQTSRSYLVGREGKSEKMAPFRADLGPRVFRGLGAREHNVQVRR